MLSIVFQEIEKFISNPLEPQRMQCLSLFPFLNETSLGAVSCWVSHISRFKEVQEEPIWEHVSLWAEAPLDHGLPLNLAFDL